MKTIISAVVAGVGVIAAGQTADAGKLETPFGALIGQRVEVAETHTENGQEITKTFEGSVSYDNWEDDFEGGDEGEVFTENAKFTLVVKNLKIEDGKKKEKDRLTFKITGAHVRSSVERGGIRESTNHLADTKVSVGYRRPRGPGSSVTVTADFNLPTGLTEATVRELLAKPSTSIVSGNFLGKGFDFGLTTKYTRKVSGDPDSESKISFNKKSNVFFGAGATRRGGYDSNADPDKGNVESGIQFKAFAGFEAIDFANMSWNSEGTYTRGQGVAGEVSNSFGLKVEVERNLNTKKTWKLNAANTLEYNDTQPDVASAIQREDEYKKGFSDKVEVGLTYLFGVEVKDKNDPKNKTRKWIWNTTFKGSLSDKRKPVDNTFFATSWSAAVIGKLSHQLNIDDSIFLSLKRAETGSESSTGEPTQFSSWTGVVGASLKF